MPDIKVGRGFITDHLIQQKFVLLGLLFIGWMNSVISFLLPVSIGEFFTIFFHTSSSKGKLLNWLGIELTSIHQFFIFFLSLLAGKALLTFLENYGTSLQGEKLARNVRETVFTYQMLWDPVWFKGRAYGKYLLRYSNDMKSVQHYLTKGYIEGIKSSLFLFTGLLIMYQINPMITFYFFLMLLLGWLIVSKAARWQSRYISQSRSSRSSLLAFVAHNFSRFARFKEPAETSEVGDAFRQKSENLFSTNMKYNITESLLLTMVPILIFGIIGLLLWRMEYLQGKISASDSLMIILILLMMEGGIRRLLKVPSYIIKGKISLQKINKLLHEPRMAFIPEIKSTGSIQIQN